jgi:hypothetical protein
MTGKAGKTMKVKAMNFATKGATKKANPLQQRWDALKEGDGIPYEGCDSSFVSRLRNWAKDANKDRKDGTLLRVRKLDDKTFAVTCEARKEK